MTHGEVFLTTLFLFYEYTYLYTVSFLKQKKWRRHYMVITNMAALKAVATVLKCACVAM